MEPEKKSNEALVGLVVIVIILIIGGVYIWQSKVRQMEIIKAKNEAILKENAALLNEDVDSLDALEKDLKNTDTNIGVDTKTIK